jgi:Na+/H+ antiporter NhaA
MNTTLIIAVIVSLCIGGAAGVGASRYLVEKPACSGHDSSWQKFINVPPLPTNTGKSY